MHRQLYEKREALETLLEYTRGYRCNRYAYIWLLQFLSKSLLVQRPRAVRIPRAHPRLPDAREPVHEHGGYLQSGGARKLSKGCFAARTEVGDADEWRD